MHFKRLIPSFLLLVIAFSLSPARASETVAIGASCDTVGVTTLATNQQNIVACLKDTSGNLVWKSMNGGSVPVGSIIAWPSATNPDDADKWLECNGQTISNTAYPDLFRIVGATVPNLQGVFLRGLGSQVFAQPNGTTIGTTPTTYTSGALGHVQGDAIRDITGAMSGFKSASGYNQSESGAMTIFTYTGGSYDSEGWGPSGLSFAASRIVPTSTENRPVNVAVRYLIRALP